MEKMLWTAIAVLWMSLLAGTTLGAPLQDAVDYPGPDRAVVQNVSLSTPVRSVAVERMVRPVVEIGQNGSGELAGAALIGAAFVFRALRRRGLV